MVESLENIRRLVHWWRGLAAHGAKHGYDVEFTAREKALIAFSDARGGRNALCRPFELASPRAQRVFRSGLLLEDHPTTRRIRCPGPS